MVFSKDKQITGLEEALNNFKNKRIIVLGDVILDKFSWGKIDSLNPEQPAAPKVKIKNETYALGGAANVANNVAALGAGCRLYGVLGKDFYGEKIRKLCEEKNISLNNFFNDNPTIMKQRIMAHGQQITRLDYGEFGLSKTDEQTQKAILEQLESDFKKTDFVILSDYNKGFFDKEFGQKIINLANSKGVRTLVDAKPSNIEFFVNCTIIRPNENEASQMTGIKYENGPGLLRMGRKLAEILNSKYAVITCGEDGVFSYERDTGKSAMIPTKARKIADVAGAGDTFAAALSLGLSSGLDIYSSSTLANYAAGNVVEKSGIEITTIDEIKERLLEDLKR
jgi:D-glycero-beta-D-manno-heptose-7-phosphate kinase